MALVGDVATGLITSNNSTQSPLLRLPRELRDQIYGHVFEDSVSLVDAASTQQDIRDPEAELAPAKSKGGECGFIMSCKHIYHEAVGIYYENTRFQFTDPEIGATWLSNLPRPNMLLVDSVRFDAVKHHSVAAVPPFPSMCGSSYDSWQRLGVRRTTRDFLHMLERDGVELRRGVLEVSEPAGWEGGKRWTSYERSRAVSIYPEATSNLESR